MRCDGGSDFKPSTQPWPSEEFHDGDGGGDGGAGASNSSCGLGEIRSSDCDSAADGGDVQATAVKDVKAPDTNLPATARACTALSSEYTGTRREGLVSRSSYKHEHLIEN